MKIKKNQGRSRKIKKQKKPGEIKKNKKIKKNQEK